MDPAVLPVALQYGALGLLALVLIGVAWYVRAVERRQAHNDRAQREERLKHIEIQTGVIKALTALTEKVDQQGQVVAATCQTLSAGHEQIRNDVRELERCVERLRGERHRLEEARRARGELGDEYAGI